MTDDVTAQAVRDRLAAVIYSGLMLDPAEAAKPAEDTAEKAVGIARQVMECFVVLPRAEAERLGVVEAARRRLTAAEG